MLDKDNWGIQKARRIRYLPLQTASRKIRLEYFLIQLLHRQQRPSVMFEDIYLYFSSDGIVVIVLT